MSIITKDIQHFISLKNTVLHPNSWIRFGPRIDNRHDWRSVTPAEDGFVNNSLALYGITARLASYAENHGIDNGGKPIGLRDVPETERLQILKVIHDEWRELVLFVNENDVDISYMRSKRSLLYRGFNELKVATEEHPDLLKERIIRSFISSTRVFDKELADMEDVAHKKAQALKSLNHDGALSKRERQMRATAEALLQDDNNVKFSEALEPGEIVYVDNPDAIDDVIFSARARMADRMTAWYGEPTGNVWKSPTKGKSVIERLTPKNFYGKLENPRVIIVPADDEYIDTYLQSTDENVDRESVVRLNAIVDMRSTGKGIVGQSLLDVVLYTRNSQDVENRMHVLSVRGTASGQKVAAYLNLESNIVARRAISYALQNPIGAGLMSPK